MTVEYRRPSMGAAESADMENMAALIERQEAVIEYVAMMADIELEEEEDGQLREEG